MKNKKYLINLLIIFIVGSISIYLSIGDKYNDIIASFKQANLWWLVIIVLLVSAYYLFDALSLWCFGRHFKKDYSFKQSLVNSMSGLFFSAITPFSSGGQFAQVFVFNKQGISPKYSSSILLMCFISYQTVLVAYTAILVLIKHKYFFGQQSGMFGMAVLGFSINLAVIASLYIGSRSKRFQDFITKSVLGFLSRIKLLKNYEVVCGKVEKSMDDFREQLKYLQANRKVLYRSFLFNTIKLTILYSVPYFAFLALNVDMSSYNIIDFIGMCSFIYLINAFFPVPGASGGSEGFFLVVFGFMGPVVASSAMFLWRFMTYYLALLSGGTIFLTNKEINFRRKG